MFSDPESEEIRMLFSGQEDSIAFPHPSYCQQHGILLTLRTLGLQSKLSSKGFLGRISHIRALNEKGDTDPAMSLAVHLLGSLDRNWAKLCEGEDFVAALRDADWVPVGPAPNNYPLPWFHAPAKLCKPTEIRMKKDSVLIGAVMPVRCAKFQHPNNSTTPINIACRY